MNVNRVILAGRLTRDPELRKTDGGTSVCEISMAINRKYTTAGGEKKTDTCFVDIVFWGNKAEYLAEHTKKATELFVEGRLELDQWKSKDGENRSRLRVVADFFQWIGKTKSEGLESSPPDVADPPEGA